MNSDESSRFRNVVVCGHEGHLSYGGVHELFPNFEFDLGAVFGERRLYVAHGDVDLEGR